MKISTTATLDGIERMFRMAHRNLWHVGGSVRDRLANRFSNDIDLATDATPDEQIAIYVANGVRYEPTGMHHGTLTVIRNDEIYEITTLRSATGHTRDIETDLGHRDFTINAIAADFRGRLIDPFGGREDLAAGRVRFVRDPVERIREDHLRILRWFRFLGRFADKNDVVFDRAAYDAVTQEATGLKTVSVERIWSETGKILTGPCAIEMMRLMHSSRVTDAIGLPVGSEDVHRIALSNGMDRATTLGGYLGRLHPADVVEDVTNAWKLSNEEKKRARFVAARISSGYGLKEAQRDVVKGWNPDLVSDTLRLVGNSQIASMIMYWSVPTFPVASHDLIADGMTPGPELGGRLRRMREEWIESDYSLDASELMARVPA